MASNPSGSGGGARRRSGSGAGPRVAAPGAQGNEAVGDLGDLSARHVELSADMMKALAAYAAGELEASAEDYELLAKLNTIAAEEYRGAGDRVAALEPAVGELKEKCTSRRAAVRRPAARHARAR